jgi:hypothetical protein
MTHSSPVAQLSCEFDNFLYASIGEDQNGLLLRVLSVLARSDLDPWEEAARLARLPEKYATARLAELIAALPGRPSGPIVTGTIAARLIALLPRRSTTHVAVPGTKPVFGVAPNSWAVVCVVLMVLALGVQWVAASNQPPAKPDSAAAPTSATYAPVEPPPNPGQ